jgi:phage gp29-like protein
MTPSQALNTPNLPPATTLGYGQILPGNLPVPLNPVAPNKPWADQAPPTVEAYSMGVVRPPVPPPMPDSEGFGVELAKSGRQFGQSGTLIFQGIITLEEYNLELTGWNGIDIYDKMRRSDGTVRAALLVCKLPIIAAKWFIDPASQSPEDLMIQQWVAKQLFENLNWKHTIEEMLTEFEFGFYVGELLYKSDVFEGKTYIGLDEIASRKQRTIFSWVTQFDQQGVTQIVPSGGTLSIPREKLVYITHQKEGDNFAGLSLLRPAYKHWYIKKGVEEIDAMALEKQGLGILTITTPQQATEEDKNLARQAAQNSRANQAGYIEAPEGFLFDFMDMKAGTLRNPVDTLLYHDRQILKVVLAQFVELGNSVGKGSGSRAVAESQSDFFMDALEAEADNLEASIQKDVIERLVRINFGDNVAIPKLDHAPLGDPNIQVLSAAINQLVLNGTITTDLADEQYIRELMNLPFKDADAEAVREFKQKLEEILDSLPAIAQAAPPLPLVPGTPPYKPDVEDPNEEDEDFSEHTADETIEPTQTPQVPQLDNGTANPVSNMPSVQPVAQPSITTAILKDQLRDFVRQIQITIAKRECAGDPIRLEEIKQMELQLLQKQQELETKSAKSNFQTITPQTASEFLFIAKEQLKEADDFLRTRERIKKAQNHSHSHLI